MRRERPAEKFSEEGDQSEEDGRSAPDPVPAWPMPSSLTHCAPS
jgi:hypothetical protein